MSRIQSVFEKKGKKLVTFITAGDPDYHKSLEVLKGLPKAGADIIELGMPFTDPAADGPSIQAANNRALKAGANMKQTLRMVREFRQDDTDTPLVLMGYANPVLAYGFADFVKDAASAGIDGLIIVDLPPEEDQKLRQLTSEAGIDLIRLITPTSNEKRLPALLTGVSGFLYYVSITGVTGAAKADMNKIKPHIAEIKKQTDIPVALGFGIKTPEDAKAMAEIADAIVVGSAIVNTLADKGPDAALEQVRALAQALAS